MLGWENIQSYLNNWGKWLTTLWNLCIVQYTSKASSWASTSYRLQSKRGCRFTWVRNILLMSAHYRWVHQIHSGSYCQVKAAKCLCPLVYLKLDKYIGVSLLSDNGGEFNNSETRDVWKYEHWRDHNCC